jgi:DNA-binding transcriptional ArsR family regulator
MKGYAIKKKSNWPAVDAALEEFARDARLSPPIFAAIADRLRTAIEAPETERIDEAATMIELLFRELVAKSSHAVRTASRGDGEADIAAGYALGKVAFAQLLAARIADTRADGRFVEHLRDLRYLPLVRALHDGPLNVNALREQVGERLETVSRKLGGLRALGIVVSKKHGNVVVNMLSPAARAMVEQLGLAPVAEEPVQTVKAPRAKEMIRTKRERLDDYMKEAAHFVPRNNVLPLPSCKVA